MLNPLASHTDWSFFVDHQFESFVTCNSEDVNVDVRGGADVYVDMNVDEDADVSVSVHVLKKCICVCICALTCICIGS